MDAFKSLKYGHGCSKGEYFVVPLRLSEFFSFLMSGDKFVLPSRKVSGCYFFSTGIK
jgi:hypothetical protein